MRCCGQAQLFRDVIVVIVVVDVLPANFYSLFFFFFVFSRPLLRPCLACPLWISWFASLTFFSLLLDLYQFCIVIILCVFLSFNPLPFYKCENVTFDSEPLLATKSHCLLFVDILPLPPTVLLLSRGSFWPSGWSIYRAHSTWFWPVFMMINCFD